MLIPIGTTRGATGGFTFTLTAGTIGVSVGYISEQYAADTGNPGFEDGSITNNGSPDGGTIEILATQPSYLGLYILDGTASGISAVKIDGTSYSLSYAGTEVAGGNTYYVYEVDPFGGSTFVDGVDYEIEVA